MPHHRIDYLRFSYSPEYAVSSDRQLSVLEKIWAAFHLATQIQPDLSYEGDTDKGMHGFTHSLRLVRGGATVGYIAAGGNSGKALVDLTGQACLEVDWESAYTELERVGARLTRVDVCIDDFEGIHSVDEVRASYHDGVFDKRGQRPASRMEGPGWEDETKKHEGRSYYIGKPVNGLGYVAYEKGKQLGDEKSNWVRHELRWARTSKKEIPLNILLIPYSYAVAAYKYLDWIEGWEPAESTHLHITSEKIKLKELTHWAKQSYGKLVNVLRKVGHSDTQIVNIMRTGGTPKRLMLRDKDFGKLYLC